MAVEHRQVMRNALGALAGITGSVAALGFAAAGRRGEMRRRAGAPGFPGATACPTNTKTTEEGWGMLTEARIERGCRAGSSAAKVGGEIRAAFGDGSLRRSE